MTAPDPRPTDSSSPRRRLPGLLLIALITFLAAGCGLVTDIADLQGRIEDAGYQQVEINHNVTNGRDVVTIQALTESGTPTDEDLGTIAEIVWTTYPRTVDQLKVVLDGRTADPISREQLVDAFGERNPALDKGTGIGQVLLIGLIGVMTVLVLIVVLVIVLVRRNQRAAARTAPPSWPQPPGAPYPQFPPTPPMSTPPPSQPPPSQPQPGQSQPSQPHQSQPQPSQPPPSQSQPSQPHPPDDVQQS